LPEGGVFFLGFIAWLMAEKALADAKADDDASS
jgi:hypothetical protein